MPRPRYAKDDTTAKQKLEQAFWSCLSEVPFEKITVAQVVKQADVNRNTFYYHFDDMNDLAKTAVQDTALEPLAIRTILAAFLHDGGTEALDQIPDIGDRVDRICLLAGRHSTPELQMMLRSQLKKVWGEAFGFDPNELDLEGQLALEFASGGFLALFAYRTDNGLDYTVRDIVGFGLTDDIMRFLRHIDPSKKQPVL